MVHTCVTPTGLEPVTFYHDKVALCVKLGVGRSQRAERDDRHHHEADHAEHQLAAASVVRNVAVPLLEVHFTPLQGPTCYLTWRSGMMLAGLRMILVW